MEKSFRKASGLSLCLGSLLSIVTMALHPAGGSFEHIIKIPNVLVFSHSLGIACLPVMGFGSWGLSVLLQSNSRVSTFSFFVFCTGLIAGMLAATINGLVLPQFLSDFSTKSFDESALKIVVTYGHYINVSMTNIFVFATSVSIGIWSVLIIRSSKLPGWIGYFGLTLLVFELFGLIFKVRFTDLYGFRIFVAGLASWEIIAGIKMLSK